MILLIQISILTKSEFREIMTSYYAENKKRLVDLLIATQSFKNDDPFDTYHERRASFEVFLYSSDSVTNCGCGNPDKTFLLVMDALNLCAIDGLEERKIFTQEKFGVDYVTDNGLVQLLFYVLHDKGFIQHGGSVGYSWLADAGKVFRALLDLFVNEPDSEQQLNWEFDIDFEAVLAAN
jgi:hypothetical protein